MKVLIETVTKRKGYKNFKDIAGFNDFLSENRKKIKSFKILNESYEGTFEELLQDVMKRADFLGKMIGYAFFQMTDKSDKYNKFNYRRQAFNRYSYRYRCCQYPDNTANQTLNLSAHSSSFRSP